MAVSVKKIVYNDVHRSIYMYGLYASYFLFFVLFTGIIAISPQYLYTLEDYIKYYVCFFLLIRFNPWFSTKIKNSPQEAEFDRRIAFSAGIFLLLTTTLTDIGGKYLFNIKRKILQN